MRRQKVAGAATTNFVWDSQNVFQETDGAGVTQARYTDNPGTWGGLVSQRRSGVTTYFGFDQQSNTRIGVDSTGAVTDTFIYTAFGEEK